MALREGPRRWMMRGAQVALLVASSLLIGLRSGRPVYYTDGARQLGGPDLASSGMLRWGTPEAIAEVPGPVAGRIAELQDGRLLYGQLGPAGTADLVTWDPARPGVPPEPVYGLNTPANELAPAIAADGRVFFASDRDGGAGGYDLYVAPRLLAGAADVAPVAACNTALDETDPSPHGNGVDFVFVRSDRTVNRGDDGTLWRWRIGDALDPAPVFAAAARVQRAKQGVEVQRDPAFAPDGAALWFVRRVPGQRLQLVRSSLLNGVFDAPVVVGGEWGTGEMRSPVPDSGGHRLGLLAPKGPGRDADLWYVASAREVYPWWPGQSWLELLLAGVIATSVLLLVLLHFGRRWSSLDFVAQCLLLSLLVHVLLFLWLMGVEITGSLIPGDDGGGAFEVNVVAAASTSSSATASGGGGSDVGAEVRFTPMERALVADTPATEAVRAQAGDALAAPDGAWERNNDARTVAAEVTLADASSDVGKRDGVDAKATPSAARLAAIGPDETAAKPSSSRAAVAANAVEVAVPGNGLAKPTIDPSLFAASPALASGASPSPVANAPGVAAPALHDEADAAAGAPAAARGAADAPVAAPVLAAGALQFAPAAAPPSGGGTHRTAAEGGAHPSAELARPTSALARGPQRPSVVPGPAATPAATAPVAHAIAVPSPLRADDALRGDQPLRGDARSPAAVAKAAQPGTSSGAPARPAMAASAAAPGGPVASVLDPPTRAPAAGLDRGLVAAAAPLSLLPRAAAAAPAMPEALPMATASAYSNRFGPAKAKAIEQFGGTDATERAVASGLRYLASIQNSDGSWGDRSDFDGKYGLVYVGKTGLCVLAFLGAGHTPSSKSEYSAVVQKAVAHLLSLQDAETGAFGPSSCYGHGIATYALAECYGLTKSEALLQPLERALTWIVDHQGPRRDRRNRGGWGYFAPGLQAEDDYARVSVTSWMVMALESARLSGIELPDDVLPRAREFLELAYDQPNGWFRYNHKPSRVSSAWPTLPASTPAAAFCLMLLGTGAGNEMVDAGVRFTVERRPDQYRRYNDDDFVLRGQGNVYFWYYGTLCCFLAGGERWAQWNERLRTVLPKAQSPDGSFAPIDVYAQQAGDNRRDRGYTTAMCVLCLEVYYRYFTPLLLGR